MVDGFLLDTNVLSEPRRPRPDPRVVEFMATTEQDRLFVSVISLAEVRYGIGLVLEPTRRITMEDWLSNDLRLQFAGRILPLSEEVILRWRIIVEEGRKRGRTFSPLDLLIASTALEHGLTLVTRNVKDFVGVPVTILNTWDEPQ